MGTACLDSLPPSTSHSNTWVRAHTHPLTKKAGLGFTCRQECEGQSRVPIDPYPDPFTLCELSKQRATMQAELVEAKGP